VLKFKKRFIKLPFILAAVAILSGCLSNEMDCDTPENIATIQAEMDNMANRMSLARTEQIARYGKSGYSELPTLTVVSSEEIAKNSKGMRTCRVKLDGFYGPGYNRDYYLTYLVKNSNDPNETYYLERTEESQQLFINKLRVDMETVTEFMMADRLKAAEAERREAMKAEAKNAGFKNVDDYIQHQELNDSQVQIEKEIDHLLKQRKEISALYKNQKGNLPLINKMKSKTQALVTKFNKSFKSRNSFGISNDVLTIHSASINYKKTKYSSYDENIYVTITNNSGQPIKEIQFNFELFLNNSDQIYAASWDQYRGDENKWGGKLSTEFRRDGFMPGERIKVELDVPRGKGGFVFRDDTAENSSGQQIILYVDAVQTQGWDHVGQSAESPKESMKNIVAGIKKANSNLSKMQTDLNTIDEMVVELKKTMTTNDEKINSLKKST